MFSAALMSNGSQSAPRYNLEERTAIFGKRVIAICKTVPHDIVSTPLVSQLVRSATSIGANYMEANGAISRRDFRSKMHICKKEARETLHWLRMLAEAEPTAKERILPLWKENQELVRIFGKICSTLRTD